MIIYIIAEKATQAAFGTTKTILKLTTDHQEDGVQVSPVHVFGVHEYPELLYQVFGVQL